MSVRSGAGWLSLAGTVIVAASCSNPFVAADADGSGGGIGEGGDSSDVTGTGGDAPGTGGDSSGGSGSGGLPTSGGAPGSGGQSPGSGGQGSGGATMVEEVGGACSSNGVAACSLSSAVQQLVCENGTWTDAGTCGAGQACDPALGPTLGSCQDIVPECENRSAGDAVCRDREAYQCGPNGVSRVALETCDTFCTGGACDVPPSCEGASVTCGAASCCESPLVLGGTFGMGESGTTSTVSISDFRLDTFEVTVSRFRPFLAAVLAGVRPEAGAGKHLHLQGGGLGAEGSTVESGWDTAWNTALPGDLSGWETQFATCDSQHASWMSVAGSDSDETRPINCVDWFQAVAFCIWDGGFLPSEAEWEYAARGGDQQRLYPWGAQAPTTALASYECLGDGAGAANDCATNLSEVLPVGSKDGMGLFGQADLAGGVWEWNLDFYHDAFPGTCADCVLLATATDRVKRGGSWYSQDDYLFGYWRDNEPPANKSARIGIRCARAP